MTEEYLAVGADEAIAVAYAGASGKGVRIEVGDRRPPTLELRHESARRNSEDVAGQEQRQVQEVGGGSYTNASANERRREAPDRFRPGRSWTLTRHAPSDRGHDPAGVCPMITPRLLVASAALRERASAGAGPWHRNSTTRVRRNHSSAAGRNVSRRSRYTRVAVSCGGLPPRIATLEE